jgi:hypothetical protein
MWAILTGEFFWGIVVGAVLSIAGAWFLAKFQEDRQRRHQKKVVIDFCIDTVRNLQGVIREMDKTRDRARAIHHTFSTSSTWKSRCTGATANTLSICLKASAPR